MDGVLSGASRAGSKQAASQILSYTNHGGSKGSNMDITIHVFGTRNLKGHGAPPWFLCLVQVSVSMF